MTDDQLHALDDAAALIYTAEHMYDKSPAFHSIDADDMRQDLRYRLMGAIRRGINSCRMVAIERVAGALANLDGEVWPGCDLHVSPNWKPEQRAALTAQRRQRYRHKAVQVIAALYGYMEVEHPSETEEHRQLLIRQAVEQREADIVTVKAWKESIGMPSTVRRVYDGTITTSEIVALGESFDRERDK